jgi:phospholipid/cholesterol/gamma-HCH transport system ATP-binding protein
VSAKQPAIEAQDVETRFGESVVHRGVTFVAERGTITALIGGSGSGKSTLLREIIGLLRPTAGTTRILGSDMWSSPPEEINEVRRRFGVLFQNGALFSALTAGENVAVPLHEQTALSQSHIEELVQLRLSFVGLEPQTAFKMPSELSGGMRKRVALARALVLDPEVLFLDEPTSGLDPINARSFDSLVRTLCDSLKMTILLVTHDLDTILAITDKVIVLDEGKVIAEGPPAEISKKDHPWIREYFSARSPS